MRLRENGGRVGEGEGKVGGRVEGDGMARVMIGLWKTEGEGDSEGDIDGKDGEWGQGRLEVEGDETGRKTVGEGRRASEMGAQETE